MSEQEKFDWMVYVRCITYNHAKYIRNAMGGFTSQKTTFPFICVIVDDASIDGEQDVISHYIDEHFTIKNKHQEETEDYRMVFCRHKVNVNCFFAVYYLKYNHYQANKPSRSYVSGWLDCAKYIAICEGDDFWTSDNKLQMQVDFMESNSEYAMCYTQVKRFRQASQSYEKRPWGGPSETFDDLLGENVIPTLTVLYRREVDKVYENAINPRQQGWKMGDYPRWLWMSQMHRIKFMPLTTGVYRILAESASHSQDLKKGETFVQSTHAMKKFFIDHFNRPDLEFKNDLKRSLFTFEISAGNRKKALEIYRDIDNPSMKIRMKYYIAKFPLLYKLCKGKFFC